ncbi:MAG: c-type cytochrome [Burkholderiaceae bacterium]
MGDHPQPLRRTQLASDVVQPQTGLVYIPAQGVPIVIEHDKDFKVGTHQPGRAHSNLGWNLGYLLSSVPPKAKPFGHLLARDPVRQKEAWRQEYLSPWNGGTLATAGNLVFQGTADGRFIAFDATTGATLPQTPVGTARWPRRCTYALDGRQDQHRRGLGGLWHLAAGHRQDRPAPVHIRSRRQRGNAQMRDYDRTTLVKGVPYNPDDIPAGAALYISNCLFCHGLPAINNGGNVPNLLLERRHADPMPELIRSDALAHQGMPRFDARLTEAEAAKIVAFIQGTADAVRK